LYKKIDTALNALNFLATLLTLQPETVECCARLRKNYKRDFFSQNKQINAKRLFRDYAFIRYRFVSPYGSNWTLCVEWILWLA